MHLSAMAYNLKKYLKFISKTVRSDANNIASLFSEKTGLLQYYISRFNPFKKNLKLPEFIR
jgi:hypothetical protein